jgi:hypothetical protein
MEILPSANGQTNVVSNVYWYVEAESDQTHQVKNMDGSFNTIPYRSSYPSNTAITYAANTPFTPYDQLSENVVVEWVQETLGNTQVAAILSQLDTQIANQINPDKIQFGIPWIK